MLSNASQLQELRVPPNNQLEKLKGDRAGQFSVRVNDQWRVCFAWNDGDAYAVEITDYHYEWTMEKLPNVHPGEVLKEEFLDPMGISAYRLAKDIGIPQTRVADIVHGRRRVTADTALRFGKYFGVSARFWLGLQDDYDLEEEMDHKGTEIERIATHAS